MILGYKVISNQYEDEVHHPAVRKIIHEVDPVVDSQQIHPKFRVFNV